MFLHRVGEKRLQHSPSVVIPPHAPLSPRLLPACYPRYPFRNTVVARGAIDAIDFRPHIFIFPVFLFTPPFYLYISTFFYFWEGKYRKYCIYSKALCFELKFDQRVKNQSVEEV